MEVAYLNVKSSFKMAEFVFELLVSFIFHVLLKDESCLYEEFLLLFSFVSQFSMWNVRKSSFIYLFSTHLPEAGQS